jgi:hypothetical protein
MLSSVDILRRANLYELLDVSLRVTNPDSSVEVMFNQIAVKEQS